MLHAAWTIVGSNLSLKSHQVTHKFSGLRKPGRDSKTQYDKLKQQSTELNSPQAAEVNTAA